MASVPERLTVPFAGCETMRSVRAFPSGSLATKWTTTGVPLTVDAVRFVATGGRFGLGLLVDGPL